MGNKKAKKIRAPGSVMLVRNALFLISCLFIVAGILAFFGNLSGVNTPKEFGPVSGIIVTQVLGLPFYIGYFGLVFKANWARLYCSTLLFILILSIVGISIRNIYKGWDVRGLSPLFIPVFLMGWLFYSFSYGNASEYFKRLKKNAALDDDQGTLLQDKQSYIETDFYEVEPDKRLRKRV